MEPEGQIHVADQNHVSGQDFVDPTGEGKHVFKPGVKEPETIVKNKNNDDKNLNKTDNNDSNANSSQYLCEPCKVLNIQSGANYVCTHCENELLCIRCADTHRVMKSTRAHVLSDVREYHEQKKSREKFCEPCSEMKKTSIAILVCQQCENEFLCQDCSNTHKIMKATRSHVLLDIQKHLENTIAEEKLCEPCAAMHKKSPAILVCQQCDNELLCKDCSDTHKIMKATRSHVMLAIDMYIETAKPEEILCEPCATMHKTSPAILVCPQCDNELLCRSCSDTHKRMKATRSHVLIDIEKYIETEKPKGKFCEQCEMMQKATPAVLVCAQCNDEFLCKICSDTHRMMKATRSHILLDIEKYIVKDMPKEELCEQCAAMNKASPAILVCEQCENELLCKKCSDSHRLMKATRLHVLLDIEKFMEKANLDKKLCERCATMNKTSEAVFFCQQCENELLCKNCSDTHKILKSTRLHVLVDVAKYDEQSKQETKFCDPCSRRNISSEAMYVCQQCNNDLLCERCSGSHKGMEFTALHELSDIKSFMQNKETDNKRCDPCSRRHIFKTAIYLCQDCENDLLCEDCLEKHKSVNATSFHATQSLEKMKANTRCHESVTLAGMADSRTKANNRRKPGKPSTVYVGVDSICLTWAVPETFESGDFYQVSYKESSSGSGWTNTIEEFKENKALMKGFASDCEYIFRVNYIYGETEGSLSDASDPVKTLPSPASSLVKVSVKSTQADVSPTKFSLSTTEIKDARNEKAKTRKLEIGANRPMDWSEKTIMVIGETGTGKSTLVDGMVNYILGVKWTDPYRLTIVKLEDEENSRKHNQALSQTEWITCYKINHMDGSRIQYTLNIIDTPGFGDTRGLERDNAIVDQIRELFTESGPKGILTIDAVCFLIKAPDARLTPMQRYIFQSIMSLFGKDIEKNICSMVTFADGIDPPVFAALDESGLPFGKRFTFNNSGLYAKNTNIDQYSLSPMFWKMGMASFENFFTHVDSMQRRSLRLTGDVLNERNRLEATIKNLEPKLDAGLFQIDQLKKVIKTFEDNQSIITANKDFTYVTKKTQQKKSELPKGQHVTNCTPCTYTCHVPCQYPDDAQKRNCCAMDANGYCTMCPGKCFWDKHANTPYIFTYEIIEETKTYSEMKEKYEKASGQLLTQEGLLENVHQELEVMAETIEDMMDVVMECNQRLSEIALRPNPLTMTDHIDLMIENEKNTKKEGWMDRIRSLEKLKKRANILEHVDDFSKKAKSVRNKNEKEATNAQRPRNIFKRIKEVFGF